MSSQAPIYDNGTIKVLTTGNEAFDALLIERAQAMSAAQHYDSRADKLRSDCSMAQSDAQKMRDRAKVMHEALRKLGYVGG